MKKPTPLPTLRPWLFLLLPVMATLVAALLLLTWGQRSSDTTEAVGGANSPDLSIAIGAGDTTDGVGCDTSGGPTKCNIGVGNSFTVTAFVQSAGGMPDTGNPNEFGEYAAYSVGLAISAGLIASAAANTWPECGFAVTSGVPGVGATSVNSSCAVGLPPAPQFSEHAVDHGDTGDISTFTLSCDTVAVASVMMVHGAGLNTSLKDTGGKTFLDLAGTETIAINCVPPDEQINITAQNADSGAPIAGGAYGVFAFMPPQPGSPPKQVFVDNVPDNGAGAVFADQDPTVGTVRITITGKQRLTDGDDWHIVQAAINPKFAVDPTKHICDLSLGKCNVVINNTQVQGTITANFFVSLPGGLPPVPLTSDNGADLCIGVDGGPSLCAAIGSSSVSTGLLPVGVHTVTFVGDGSGKFCAGNNIIDEQGGAFPATVSVDVGAPGSKQPKLTFLCTHFDGVFPVSSRLSLAAGNVHTCALTLGGGVRCWGSNGSGQLGDGTTQNRNISVPVCASGESAPCNNVLGSVAAVDAGFFHTCALTMAGGVKCWGNNFRGPLGDGTEIDRTTPVDVCASGQWDEAATQCLDGGAPSALANVVAVAGGGNHTCALIDDGPAPLGFAVKCWGLNTVGQLGDGTTTNRTAPVDVCASGSGAGCAGGVPLTGVTAIAAGGDHTCAIVGASVKCWGRNHFGQLGNSAFTGANTGNPTPVDVAGLGNVVAIAAGVGHTCALGFNGSVHCWGANFNDQLGTTSAETCSFGLDCSSTPIELALGSPGARFSPGVLSASFDHTCLVTWGEYVKCWGINFEGQLGDGQTCGTASCAPPVDVCAGGAQTCTKALSDVASVAAGGGHSCALLETDLIKCWGRNLDGALGNGTNDQSTTPAGIVPFPSFAVFLAKSPPVGGKVTIAGPALFQCDAGDPSAQVTVTLQYASGDTSSGSGTGMLTFPAINFPQLNGGSATCKVNDAVISKLQINVDLIDPSGRVFDTNTGFSIPGAQVTLEIEDPPSSGIFRPVDPVTDAALKEPDINPQTTGLNGRYAWDVAAGTYRVRVQRLDCSSVTSSPVTVPPPVTDLDIGLDCADADGDGIPDALELEFITGTAPADPDSDGDGTPDGSEDPDGDGQTILQELAAGTDPLVSAIQDTDFDGCSDQEELGPNQSLGGLRDFTNFWDFFDTHTENGLNAGTRLAGLVDIGDILNIVLRFGQSGDPNIDPLSDATAMSYHTRYDRGGPMAGQNPWNRNPPDGLIEIGDILAAVQQFGHSCL